MPFREVKRPYSDARNATEGVPYRSSGARCCTRGDFPREWTGGYLVRSGSADRLYNTDWVIRRQQDGYTTGHSHAIANGRCGRSQGESSGIKSYS